MQEEERLNGVEERNNGVAVEELREDSKRARRKGERMRACDESPSPNHCGEGYCPTRLCSTRSIPPSRNDRKVRLETKRNCSFL